MAMTSDQRNCYSSLFKWNPTHYRSLYFSWFAFYFN